MEKALFFWPCQEKEGREALARFKKLNNRGPTALLIICVFLTL
jgi:hypothetical protein